MTRFSSTGLAIALALLASNAQALLNDKPYFNLWTTGVDHGGLIGDNTSVSLCGTAACKTGAATTDYAIFSVVGPNTGAGSGAIDPFLRFQHNEGPATGSSPTEAAYNTNFRSSTNPTNVGAITDLPGTPLNQAKDANAFNHVIRLSDLAVDIVNGMVTFKLDINEPGGNKETLRLDELALFISNSATLNNFDVDGPDVDALGTFIGSDGNPLANVKRVWDMDFNRFKPGATGDTNPNKDGGQTGICGQDKNCTPYGGLNLSNINDSGKAGSGDYDMQMQISKKLFTDALADLNKTLGANLGESDAYVYLYNFAGEADPTCDPANDPVCSTEAEAGFEEWAAVVKTAPGGGGVPEPGTALLIGGGLLGLAAQRRRGRTTR